MKKCVNCKYFETHGEHKGRMMYYCDHMSARKYTENDFIFFMLSTPLYSKVISVALRPKRIF